jgi:hypothetical protein
MKVAHAQTVYAQEAIDESRSYNSSSAGAAIGSETNVTVERIKELPNNDMSARIAIYS